MKIKSAALTLAIIVGLAAPLSTSTPNAYALPSVSCAALNTPVYMASKPDGTTLLTTSDTEAQGATKYGFTYRGAAFKAARSAESGLVPVHRLYRDGDFAYIVGNDQIAAMIGAGYVDQSIAFFAATESAWCTAPVFGMTTKGGRHQYATVMGEGATVSFEVAAPPLRYPAPTKVSSMVQEANPKDPEFTFAVIPDTQQEVHRRDDQRLQHRSDWLVANRSRLDLRWAVQVGDLVDWDTDDHYQYELARKGMQPLIDAKLPMFLNIGNHDSQATTVGGGARDPRYTRTLARMTQVMNSYFSVADYSIPVGSFEPGKLDNTYTRLKAGGKNWLILNLELWPRSEVIKWAAGLISYHKHHNVIIATHSVVDQKGHLSSGPNYGSTTPRYLWDHLVKKYPNVKFVVCGHTGTAKNFVMKGSKGNKIYVMLTTYHSNTDNPVRLVRVNTRNQTVSTWVEGPWTNKTLMAAVKYSRIGLVK